MSHASVIVALDKFVGSSAELQTAVAEQMAPFDEKGEWFADGSRWDWWVIGGRFSGKLLGRDACYRRYLTEEALKKHAADLANKLWDAFDAEKSKTEFTRKYLYGFDENETRSVTVFNSKRRRLTASAFLRDKKWIESGRMGWFGVAAATECERATDGEWTERCVYRDEETGGQIATFTGPKDTEDNWNDLYWARFIRPLPGDTMLVVVDYHV